MSVRPPLCRCGFTLLETLLYIVLLSMVVPTLILMVANLVRADERYFDTAVVSHELDFVFHKLSGFLNGVALSEIEVTPERLVVKGESAICLKRSGEDDTVLGIYRDSHCTGTFELITSSQVKLTQLLFEKKQEGEVSFLILHLVLHQKNYELIVPLQ